MEDFAAELVDAVRTYEVGGARVVALDHVSLGIRRGRFTVIVGPSGSGKTTLLHCLAGLEALDSGRAMIGGRDLAGLDDDTLTRLRRERVGVIFQDLNLLQGFSVADNLALPMSISGRPIDPAWYDRVVDGLGLRDRLRHSPAQLSGGQQQRVAAARALLGRPDLVVADEPTGSLDSATSAEVLDMLRRAVDEFGQTVVVVTHDPAATALADTVVTLGDGRVSDLRESA